MYLLVPHNPWKSVHYWYHTTHEGCALLVPQPMEECALLAPQPMEKCTLLVPCNPWKSVPYWYQTTHGRVCPTGTRQTMEGCAPLVPHNPWKGVPYWYQKSETNTEPERQDACWSPTILAHLNVAIGSVLQVGEVLPVSDVEQEGCALLQHLWTGLYVCTHKLKSVRQKYTSTYQNKRVASTNKWLTKTKKTQLKKSTLKNLFIKFHQHQKSAGWIAQLGHKWLASAVTVFCTHYTISASSISWRLADMFSSSTHCIFHILNKFMLKSKPSWSPQTLTLSKAYRGETRFGFLDQLLNGGGITDSLAEEVLQQVRL